MATAAVKKRRTSVYEDLDLALDLLEQTETTVLQPLAFFVSWHGVLTLAYSGFPEPLVDLKNKLNSNFDLPPENSGSKWPKTTLGALQTGNTLTKDDVMRLQQICREASEGLQDGCAEVSTLKIVKYCTRSLEKIFSEHTVNLKNSSGIVVVSQSQQENVQNVLNEGDDPNYWEQVAKDGSRVSHYREDTVGSTLMIPLKCKAREGENNTDPITEAANQLMSKVENDFPGYYTFFEPQSRHITVRALF